jgi:hypothetical protein
MKNVGGADRVIRIVLGIAMITLFFYLPGYWKLAGTVSIPLLITGLAQKCAINKMLGRNTCSIR